MLRQFAVLKHATFKFQNLIAFIQYTFKQYSYPQVLKT